MKETHAEILKRAHEVSESTKKILEEAYKELEKYEFYKEYLKYLEDNPGCTADDFIKFKASNN